MSGDAVVLPRLRHSSPLPRTGGEGEGLRRYTAFALLILLALSLAACGKRNLPTSPDGEETTYPRQYPRV